LQRVDHGENLFRRRFNDDAALDAELVGPGRGVDQHQRDQRDENDEYGFQHEISCGATERSVTLTTADVPPNRQRERPRAVISVLPPLNAKQRRALFRVKTWVREALPERPLRKPS
jgi:hypothetical protein